MARIIDVDAHFEPGDDWLEPYPSLAARLPKLNPGLLAVDTIVGDLLRNVPEAEQPPLEALLPPGLLTLFGQEKTDEKERRAEFEGQPLNVDRPKRRLIELMTSPTAAAPRRR